MFVISGVTGGFLALMFFAVVGIFFGFLAYKSFKDREDSDRFFLTSLVSTALLANVFMIGTLSYGFDMKYAQVYRGTGVVEEVTNVMVEGSGVASNQPLVKFEGNDELYKFYDSRVSTYTGYEIDVRCKIDKSWLSMDENTCTVLGINDRGDK